MPSPSRPDPSSFPSYEEAGRFLSALDFEGRGQDGDFAFQTFPDSASASTEERKALVSAPYGNLRDLFRHLAELNSRGAGVHVGLCVTDGNGRQEHNILAPRAVVLDFDDGYAARGTGAVPVSAVVRSARGPHVYWMLHPGEDLARWRVVSQALALRYGSDDAATLLTQTMRLPGFLHRKGEPRPVWVEILEARRYTLDEIVAGFGLEREFARLDEQQRVKEETARRQLERAKASKPTRPVDTYSDRLERARAFIAPVPGVASHRNIHIAKHVASIGWSFGLEEEEWAREVCAWNDTHCSPPLDHKEVSSVVRSLFKRCRASGAPFGWRLSQNTPEWEERQRAREDRVAAEEEAWRITLTEAPVEPHNEEPLGVATAMDPRAPFPPLGVPDWNDPGGAAVFPAAALLDLRTFGYLATPPLPDGHPLSVRGNSQRFVETHAAQVRFVPKLKDWYVWDGRRWEKDQSNSVHCLGQQVVAAIHKLVDHPDVAPRKAPEALVDAALEKFVANERRKDGLRAAIKSHVQKSETPTGVKELLEYASWQRSVVVMPEQLDTDDHLFNAQNGTVDLRSLDLLPHDPKRYQTRIAPVAYVPKARCPLWEDHVRWAMGGNEEMVTFLQRAAGYSLSGYISEQVFFVCYGTGGNGKSTFLTTLLSLAADYGKQCPFDMFLASAMRPGASPNEELLALKDVRLAFAAEPEEGARLKEDLIKQITGGEKISARPLWGKPISFTPKFSLWFSCNAKPAIRGTDEGIWRRVLLIPWEANIDKDPGRHRDLRFADKLVPEYEGILAWALAGAHAWWKDGLAIPDSVRAATKEYRDDMDTLGDFLDLHTVASPNAQVGSSDLYRAYSEWCERCNERPWKQKTFSQRVQDRGFEKRRTKTGNVFLGLGIILKRY